MQMLNGDKLKMAKAVQDSNVSCKIVKKNISLINPTYCTAFLVHTVHLREKQANPFVLASIILMLITMIVKVNDPAVNIYLHPVKTALGKINKLLCCIFLSQAGNQLQSPSVILQLLRLGLVFFFFFWGVLFCCCLWAGIGESDLGTEEKLQICSQNHLLMCVVHCLKCFLFFLSLRSELMSVLGTYQ